MTDTDPVPYHVFERVQGTVLDRLEEVESIKHELQNGKLREQVALGVADGLAGIGGPPLLNRPVPFWLRFLRPVGRWWNRKRQ